MLTRTAPIRGLRTYGCFFEWRDTLFRSTEVDFLKTFPLDLLGHHYNCLHPAYSEM